MPFIKKYYIFIKKLVKTNKYEVFIMDTWQNWVSALIGLWIVVSGFVPSLFSKWIIIISCVLISILNFWSANM